jgi:oligopeptide/dipeptide ABC transporter, ATP-binding protein, C-terminal domain
VSKLELLNFSGVYKYFRDPGGGFVTAVDGVDLAIQENEVIALVGESGSGKTTLGRLSVRLVEPSRGKILFEGRGLEGIRREELWRRAQYIHQDPYSSLDPYLTVGEVLDRPLRYLLGVGDPKETAEMVSGFLDKIGMHHIAPTTRINRLSGGERQRILVSRAFIIKPKFVAADEPTTMVDFIHRNEVLNLLLELKKESGSSILFITHDLSLASHIADRVVIMHSGKIVEMGSRADVVQNPLHPYTQALFSVTPDKLLGQKETPRILAKPIPRYLNPSTLGCKYASNCPYVFERCRRETPTLIDVGKGHFVSCFKYG